MNQLNERDSNAATKGDLKDLEIKMLAGFIAVQKEITAQTWRFLGGITLLGALFKIADLLLHK